MTDTLYPSIMWGRKPYPHSGSNLGTGNRCGHDPANPALDQLALPATKSGYRPKLQQQLIDAAKHYYYTPKDMPLLSNLSRKVNRDGTPRQNRSEGREAQSLILSAILSMTDFCSLRVGTPMANGTFKSRSCDEIARACGLVEPSDDPSDPLPVASQRFHRGLQQLKRAAAIEVFEQYEEKPDGSKRARTAIKTVSANFLIALGRIPFAAFKTFRDECSKKLRNWRNKWRQAAPGEFDAAKAAELVRKDQFRIGSGTRKVKKNQTPKTLPGTNGHALVQTDYSAYVRDLTAQTMDEHPGVYGKALNALVRQRAMTLDQFRMRQAE